MCIIMKKQLDCCVMKYSEVVNWEKRVPSTVSHLINSDLVERRILTLKQKRDTAWSKNKKDTNHVNLNNNVQDDRRARLDADDHNKNAVVTSQLLVRENKKLWRRARVQAYSGSC